MYRHDPYPKNINNMNNHIDLFNSTIQKLENPINLAIILSTSTLSFIGAYFYDITFNNAESFLAVIAVVLLDGLFGIIAGAKREGFKTYKALKVLRTTFVWIIILAVLLSVEKGFVGVNWLSEVIILPFLVFQIISALKNASMAGYIEAKLLNEILDKIDNHKGIRNDKTK
jgi:phage-related holin